MDGIAGRTRALTVGVPRERILGERRVALVPESVSALTALGLTVALESGAGSGAYFPDDAYQEAGARVEAQGAAVYADADIVTKVQAPLLEEIDHFRPGSLLISLVDPVHDAAVVKQLAARGVSIFSFNALPRSTRAQSMDVLSAMSTIAGYRAVLLAANALGRFFPMLMTAAGTVPPAQVVVIGAGVAGLQALATARRLGARTSACDARPVVREQIESVGASYIDMCVPLDGAEDARGYATVADEDVCRRQRDGIRESVAAADVVISTAQVPGSRAPLLIDEYMVRAMRPGSVIVDLAAESGGNCELTVLGKTVTHSDVTIIGPTNLAATLPIQASQMFARNVVSVIKHVTRDGVLELDPADEILSCACLTLAAPGRA